MSKRNLILIAVLISGGSLGVLASPRGDQKSDRALTACCQIVQAALQSAGNIQAGMKRSDVEKDFIKDGGVTFRQDTTYLFRKCHDIKIHVSFAPDGKEESNDVVQQVSKPYIEYENRD